MRVLYFLLIGALGGVVATVMVQTLQPNPPDPKPEPGGGNARLSLDEDALALIAQANLPVSISLHGPTVAATVREDGVVELAMTYVRPASHLPEKLLFNPEIVAGDLELAPVPEEPVEPAPPEDALTALEEALRARIVGLAGVATYQLAAITTVDRRLGFEVRIEAD